MRSILPWPHLVRLQKQIHNVIRLTDIAWKTSIRVKKWLQGLQSYLSLIWTPTSISRTQVKQIRILRNSTLSGHQNYSLDICQNYSYLVLVKHVLQVLPCSHRVDLHQMKQVVFGQKHNYCKKIRVKLRQEPKTVRFQYNKI